MSTGAAVLLAGSALSINPASAAANPHASRVRTPQAAASGNAGAQGLLLYGGGPIVVTPRVVIDFWGSGWSRDPSHEANYLTNFLTGVGQATGTNNDTWSASTMQYCQGSGQCVGMAAATGALTGTPWFHNVRAPSRPNQGQLAAEAVAAFNHFQGVDKTLSPTNVQVVVATAHGNNSSGFGVQYCAWHSATTLSNGSRLSYTNLPYITDAGGSCGTGFVNGSLGANDGISIVEGHEYAETVTDPVPSSGWVDASGAENGDKCAWISPGQQGGAADINLATGSFAVQSLFSNNYTVGSAVGGCVISYTNNGGTQS